MALMLRRSPFTLYGSAVFRRKKLRAGKQTIHVLRLTRIATKQPVPPQDPHVARLGYRFIKGLGHIVWIGLSIRRSGPLPKWCRCFEVH